jgi:hypothetical protein
LKLKKNKAVPLQAWSGPEGSRKLKFPDFMTAAQDGGKVVSLTHRPPLSSENTPGAHISQRLSRPQGHSASGRIILLKNSNDTIGNRTRNLPIYSVVLLNRYNIKYGNVLLLTQGRLMEHSEEKNHFSTVHTLTSHFLKIRFNIAVSLTRCFTNYAVKQSLNKQTGQSNQVGLYKAHSLEASRNVRILQ